MKEPPNRDKAINLFANKIYERFFGLYYLFYKAYKIQSDRYERKLLAEFIKPGMTVVDVGANIGIFSRYLSDLVGPQGKVYAFEPDATNFKHLSRNLRACSNVELIQEAVSDETGEISLFVSSELNIDHRTYDNGEGRHQVKINAHRLDDFFPPGTCIDFIKTDIQGGEYKALRGMQRVLTENPNLNLLIEFWPWGLTQFDENGVEMLIDLIKSYDFAIDLVKDGQRFPYKPGCVKLHLRHYGNLLLHRS